jgi:Family of unknown function (DUF5641)
MYSDQGRNFILSSRIISADQRQRLAIEKKLTWHFNPALSPSWGGAWERLIRDSMKAQLNGRAVAEKVFECLLLQVEDIINSRPLTNLPVSPDDHMPLTPNLLVKLHPGYSFVSESAKPDNESSRFYAKRARELSQKFMKRWLKEYLPIIARHDNKGKPTSGLKLGDVVIYMDVTKPSSE